MTRSHNFLRSLTFNPLLRGRYESHALTEQRVREQIPLIFATSDIRLLTGLSGRAPCGGNEMALVTRLKQRARELRADIFALYLAARDRRTPWYAKLLVAGVVAYAFSPVDLIPDFIPVLGYLDDLVLIPIGIALAIRLVPRAVLVECRARARETMNEGKPVSRAAGAVVVAIWLVVAALCAVWIYRVFRAP